MSDPTQARDEFAVEFAGASKIYRLYQRPVYKFLDLFGLCPAGGAYFTERRAVDGVDLSIRRGEKVAIIGRNGAGKSTLLKMVTGLVQPTSGRVTVNGRISNLLQIGSGFHPDFTGRQNVFASLAHQGLVGREASRLFDEIVDFAEIGEYIDQPMKTYSTGMCSRLMFSSAVVIRPEILIVDEILGVGDAYFAHKSFERMRDLSSQSGTTLLLVTHDIYSAMNLCERFVWIDHGKRLFDGDGRSAISMYETSIKAQEEESLRRSNVARLTTAPVAVQPAHAANAPAASVPPLHVLVRSRTGFALPMPLALETIELAFDDGTRSRLPVAEGAAGWTLLAESNLGAPQNVEGRRCRALRAMGSIYHKAEWVVSVPTAANLTGLTVRWHYGGTEVVDVRVFTPEHVLMFSGELGPGDAWQEMTFDRLGGAGHELDAQKQVDYGTGLIRIVDLKFLDEDGREVVQIPHGASLTVRIRARVAREVDDRHVTFVLGFWRQGSAYLGMVYEPNLLLPDGEECVIQARLAPLHFGSGQWYLNVGIGVAGLYEHGPVKYFVTDASWYHLLAGWIQLQVTSSRGVDTVGCFVVHPSVVSVAPVPTLAASPR